MIWLLFGIILINTYVLGLVGYRLFLSGKQLAQESRKTSQLLSELSDFDSTAPEPAQAVTRADFQTTLAARRALIRRRVHRRELRERRLINRIREIDVDKRWS